ncbi:DUF1692-domain-containing protein [Tilletiaria anomala UBC 951]|uniref:DUF1692-domain-containing protein n=1 Tax=Tilletiaria anomala (strain ATCC 24038 / CBS 436.72 / UBC 951) TaxID=1037660 RepID=A0A066VDN9_TILAU|nr:DUF1692-domain-containing protein [Tilletiaria anomala UBC 951]KDN39832.1 DUF1692-domain-containing protein [Tilletiaria anomala UBC 951]
MSEKSALLDQLDNLPKIRHFDAFPKTQPLYHQRSSRGGVWTVVVSAVIFLLFCSELSNYLYKEHAYEFFVDSKVGDDMQINVDMTVAMQCHYLTIDVRDAVGDRLHVSEQEFKKDGTTFEIGHAGRLDSLPMKDLRRLKEYGSKRFAKTSHLVKDGPACRIYGSMLVKKVTGNLHITTLGHGYWSLEHTNHARGCLAYNPVAPTAIPVMNLSHVVHEFSFGPYFPNLAQPLESSVETTAEHFAVFQYFVSVVPTIYIDHRGRSLQTNQYSVTDYARVVEHNRGVPGIFIKYDIEPMTMIVRERASSLLNFLVRLASTVGGVWVCSGFAYRVTNRVGTVVKKVRDGADREVDPYEYAGGYGNASATRYAPSGSGIPNMFRTASGKIINAASSVGTGISGGRVHRKTESMQQKIMSEEGRAW